MTGRRGDSITELDTIAKGLERSRKLTADGKVGFGGMGFEEAQCVLPVFIKFNEGVPLQSRRAIVTKACFEAARHKPITGALLRSTIQRVEQEYLKTRNTRFVLATAVSVEKDELPGSRTVLGAVVRFHRTLPDKLRRDRADQLRKSMHLPEPPRNFGAVTVSVNARSEADAFEKALWRLDLLRGMWNLARNSRTLSRYSSGRDPVNGIRVGPIYTLHRAGGQPASEAVWHDPEWMHSASCTRIGAEWKPIIRDEQWIRRALGRVSFRKDAEEMVVRYSRALDGRDYDAAYVKLWSVLEHATATGGSDYGQTVRRASFLWKDWEHARAVLEGLRQVRNESVHAGSSAGVWEGHLYSLKRFVEPVIWFHLKAGTRFKSFGEASEFLDLPRSVPDLDRKMTVLRWALGMRR